MSASTSGAAFVLLLGGCDGPQSALQSAGRGADAIATLFYWMAAGAVVVWVVVIGLALYAMRARPGRHGEGTGMLIIGGGVLFPTTLLAILLSFALALIPDLLAPAPKNSLRIEVIGHQWWWRVRYQPPDAAPFELANEIRLPVDEPVEFRLRSADVIHSFWIPSLGGKMDVFPGRVTRLALHPTRTGVFRGVCAEYCGTAHALMSFYAVVEGREDFVRWMQREAKPAVTPQERLAIRGAELFLVHGCGACHNVRGTAADGVVGPDLTHVGSRLSLGAGILPNDVDSFLRWIARTETVKPGVHMPAFGMLPSDDLRALAAYLDALE